MAGSTAGSASCIGVTKFLKPLASGVGYLPGNQCTLISLFECRSEWLAFLDYRFTHSEGASLQEKESRDGCPRVKRGNRPLLKARLRNSIGPRPFQRARSAPPLSCTTYPTSIPAPLPHFEPYPFQTSQPRKSEIRNQKSTIPPFLQQKCLDA